MILILVLNLSAYFVLSPIVSNQAATVIQNPKLANMKDGFLELKPNSSLTLRSTFNNSSNSWQEALVFKAISNAIRLMPPQAKNTFNDLNQKIYGDGVEHKFPPFLERVIQRIQTYFSIYKYTDTSQPQREDLKKNSTTTATTTTVKATPSSPTTNGIANATLTLDHKNEIIVNFNNANYYGFNGNSSETRTSTTTESSTPETLDNDDNNEFIEIKDRKS